MSSPPSQPSTRTANEKRSVALRWSVQLSPMLLLVAAVAALLIRPFFAPYPAAIEVFDVGVAALVLITLFRLAEGRLRFDALGFRLQGSAATLVLWTLCFILLLVAVRTHA